MVMRKNAEARVGNLCESVTDFGLPILSLPSRELSSTAVLDVACACQDVEDELHELIRVLRA